MKEQVKTAKAETAYGKSLDAGISYDYKWSEYENISELRAAKDELTDAEQVKTRNTERQSNARQKALTAALTAAGIEKPTIENDEQLRLKQFFVVLMSSKKYTEEAARELAAQTLGLTWEAE